MEQLSSIAAPGKESAGAEEALLGAAENCFAAAITAKSASVLTAALAALTNRLEAARDEESYAVLLHRSLAEALQVLGNQSQGHEEVIIVAAMHIVTTAKAAAVRGTSSLISSVTVDDVLNAAAATAAQQAHQAAKLTSSFSAQNGSAIDVAYRAGANLSSALALGAFAIASGHSRSHSLQELTNESLIIDSENGGKNPQDDEDEWGEAQFAAAPAVATLGTMSTSPTQQACLAALLELLSSPNTAVQMHAVRALGSYLQSHPPPHWAAQCAAVGLPPALANLHALLQRGNVLSDAIELQFAIETLKCGLLACNIGGEMGAATLRLVVPIMVESAAPPGQSTPALAEAAVKLLVALASGPSATAFKGAVASLPEDTRQRLQKALASVVSTGPSAAAGGGGGAAAPGQVKSGSTQRLPSIQLKKFGAA